MGDQAVSGAGTPRVTTPDPKIVTANNAGKDDPKAVNPEQQAPAAQGADPRAQQNDEGARTLDADQAARADQGRAKLNWEDSTRQEGDLTVVTGDHRPAGEPDETANYGARAHRNYAEFKDDLDRRYLDDEISYEDAVKENNNTAVQVSNMDPAIDVATHADHLIGYATEDIKLGEEFLAKMDPKDVPYFKADGEWNKDEFNALYQSYLDPRVETIFDSAAGVNGKPESMTPEEWAAWISTQRNVDIVRVNGGSGGINDDTLKENGFNPDRIQADNVITRDEVRLSEALAKSNPDEMPGTVQAEYDNVIAHHTDNDAPATPPAEAPTTPGTTPPATGSEPPATTGSPATSATWEEARAERRGDFDSVDLAIKADIEKALKDKEAPVTYTIQKGDTAWDIAEAVARTQNGNDDPCKLESNEDVKALIAELAKANNVADINVLTVGDVWNIPPELLKEVVIEQAPALAGGGGGGAHVRAI